MLHADECMVLEKAITSRKTPAGRARRARTVLMSNQGLKALEIAGGMSCKERIVLKWVNRFNYYGVTGLEQEPREGRPRVYGPEDVGAVIQAALTPARELGLPFASWTLDWPVAYLSKEKGVGTNRISRRCSRPRG